MSSGFLHRYFLNNATKRCFKFIHYIEIYERHFERFRDRAPTVVEIGVRGGGSLEMWKAYFGKDSKIVGIDIDPDCKQHEREGIEVFIGSQDDPDVIDSVIAAYPRVDIVIDDGSHEMAHLIKTFELLYPRVNPTGVYLLEDLYTCYRPKYGAGVKVAGTFIEYVKDKIDELNAPLSAGAIPLTDFSRSTDHISIYDSVIVFERRPQGIRQTLITNKMAKFGSVRAAAKEE